MIKNEFAWVQWKCCYSDLHNKNRFDKTLKSRPNWAFFCLFLGDFSEFLDGTIRDMQFVVNTAPSCLIPMLDAIDKHMLDRENRNDFEILKLQADSPNCTFST